MTDFSKYYRAYVQMQETLKSDFTYNYMSQKLKDYDKGEDQLTGKVYNRVIDMDWVETIEDCIVYIDKAIREQRRFIVQNEDIVPIEKARKITSESVRHLAQHTNLIARVEGTDVTPERILDIQREESFAIYENRFLHTLLHNVSRFVEARFKDLQNAPNDSFSKFQMKRQIVMNQQVVEFDITYSNENHERTKIDLDADVSTLTDFERVRRIRRVLSDFIASPLMRNLSGCEPVRPPILRTNLMTKNPNFKKALDLWLFIETYKKTGYIVVGNEYSGKMEADVQQEMYNVLSFQHFVLSLSTNPALKEVLHEKYLIENKRLAEESINSDAELKARITEVREEEMQIRLDEIRIREKQISDLKSTVNSQKVTIHQREDTIKELRGSLNLCESNLEKAKAEAFELEKQVMKCEDTIKEQTSRIQEQNTLIDEQKSNITRLESDLAAHAATIKTLEVAKAQLEASLSEFEKINTELKAQVDEQNNKINSLTEYVATLRAKVTEEAEKASLLAVKIDSQTIEIQKNKEKIESLYAQTTQLQQSYDEEKRLHSDDVLKQKNEYESKLTAEKDNYDKMLANVCNKHTADIESLKGTQKAELNKLTENYENKLTAQKSEKDKAVNDTKKTYENQIRKINSSNDDEIKKLKSLYEAKIKRAEKEKNKAYSVEEKIFNARLAKLEKQMKADYARKVKAVKNESAQKVAKAEKRAKEQIKLAKLRAKGKIADEETTAPIE